MNSRLDIWWGKRGQTEGGTNFVRCLLHSFVLFLGGSAHGTGHGRYATLPRVPVIEVPPPSSSQGRLLRYVWLKGKWAFYGSVFNLLVAVWNFMQPWFIIREELK